MSVVNVDQWVSDNNVSLPSRLVNGGTWWINDYTQVFEDIFEDHPGGLTLELTAGNHYGYSNTLAHGDGRDGRLIITSNRPSSHYGARPLLIAIPDENGGFGGGMENVSIAGNPTLGMPSFDKDSNGGRVPNLPEGVTAGIWSATGNISVNNIWFMTTEEVRETKPHVYLWMVRYANKGNSEDSDPSVSDSAFSPNGALNKKKKKWATAIYHEGRGLRVKDSIFANKKTAVTQSFPKDIYDATPQSGHNQHWSGGNRKLEFVGNHVHGWKSTFARFTGDYATNKGAIISGNQLDIGGTLLTVDGKGMTGAVISGNVVGNSAAGVEDRVIIDVDAREFSSNVINGNSFFGVDDTVDRKGTGGPGRVDHAIRIEAKKSIANGITNNSFGYHNDSAIELLTPTQGVNITGNTATGNFTFLKSHNKSTGIVAYNTMQGPFIEGGKNLQKNGNVRYEPATDPITGNIVDVNNRYFIGVPSKFKKKYATKIVGFDPGDTVEINETAFGSKEDFFKSVIVFVKSKSMAKAMEQTYVEFIYCRKNGSLYFNENRSEPGFGDGGIIAKFYDKPKLKEENFNFISMVDNLQLLPVQSII